MIDTDELRRLAASSDTAAEPHTGWPPGMLQDDSRGNSIVTLATTQPDRGAE